MPPSPSTPPLLPCRRLPWSGWIGIQWPPPVSPPITHTSNPFASAISLLYTQGHCSKYGCWYWLYKEFVLKVSLPKNSQWEFIFSLESLSSFNSMKLFTIAILSDMAVRWALVSFQKILLGIVVFLLLFSFQVRTVEVIIDGCFRNCQEQVFCGATNRKT